MIPAAMAGTSTDIMKATGTADARALDLDVLGLVRLTLGAADGKFTLSTEGAGTATTSGRAVGICNLITGGSDPLACSSGNVASSAAPEGPAKSDNCTVPPVNAIILAIQVACGHSSSSVSGSAPTGKHEASVAGVDVALPLDLKGLLGTATGTTKSVTDAVAGLLTQTGVALPTPLPDATGAVKPTVDTVVAQIQPTLDSLLKGVTKLASVKVLPAEVDVSGGGDKTATAKATSSVVSVGLLEGALNPDGLIQIQVTPSSAQATFNGNSSTANCHAEAAIVHVKVANLLGGGSLVDVAPGLNLDLSKLLPLGNDLVGVKVATATPDATSKDGCQASARGLELNLLKVLNGGIALRVASTNAQIAGAVTPLRLQAGPVCTDPKGCLPLTGGPTDLYMYGGAMILFAAAGMYFLSRRVRAGA